jgi:hypothetical protein
VVREYALREVVGRDQREQDGVARIGQRERHPQQHDPRAEQHPREQRVVARRAHRHRIDPRAEHRRDRRAHERERQPLRGEAREKQRLGSREADRLRRGHQREQPGEEQCARALGAPDRRQKAPEVLDQAGHWRAKDRPPRASRRALRSGARCEATMGDGSAEIRGAGSSPCPPWSVAEASRWSS